jgi:hypothetical protein
MPTSMPGSAGPPGAIRKKISSDIVKVMSLPKVAERLSQQGMILMTSTPGEFDAVIRIDALRYAPHTAEIARVPRRVVRVPARTAPQDAGLGQDEDSHAAARAVPERRKR